MRGAGAKGILFFLAVLIALLSAAIGQERPPASANVTSDPRKDYVGDDACRSCHAEKFGSFSHTAHHLTSRIASADAIAGSFAAGSNVLKTQNPDLYFEMASKPNGFFQTAVNGIGHEATTRTERMDFVIGSGRKGQAYLYWKNDALFELPVSYWTELGQWVNSPGYADGFADFSRPIVPRCLECHATYFEALSEQPGNRYRKTDFVPGISCEKCHGPGREHVARFSAKSEQKPADSAIVNPRKLSRERQMDVCALCHGGVGEGLAPAFSFVPGQPLARYLVLPQFEPTAHIDVHGSQIELLKRSLCYQKSDMTCNTCHDVHLAQRDAASFSNRCLGCHQVQSCGLYPKLGQQIAADCVDCHMPRQKTALIVSSANGKSVQPEVRNHWIKIYPAALKP